MDPRRLARIVATELSEDVPSDILRGALPVAQARARIVLQRGLMFDWHLEAMLATMYLQACIDVIVVAENRGWLEEPPP